MTDVMEGELKEAAKEIELDDAIFKPEPAYRSILDEIELKKKQVMKKQMKKNKERMKRIKEEYEEMIKTSIEESRITRQINE